MTLLLPVDYGAHDESHRKLRERGAIGWRSTGSRCVNSTAEPNTWAAYSAFFERCRTKLEKENP
jgi:hypothetical protein